MSGDQNQQPKGGGDPSATLRQLFGDDNAKLLLTNNLTKAVMETALAELTEEEMKARVETGKAKFREAIVAQKELDAFDKEYRKKTEAGRKKLGKVVNAIKSIMQGKGEPPPDAGGEAKQDAESGDEEAGA